jgi:hypothetical protein
LEQLWHLSLSLEEGKPAVDYNLDKMKGMNEANKFSSLAKLIVFGCLSFCLCCCSSFSLSRPANYQELVDMFAAGQSDAVQLIQIVNGSSKIKVNMTGSAEPIQIVVPDGQKADLVKRCLRSAVALDVRDSQFDLFADTHRQGPLTFSQLMNLLKRDRAGAIQKVYVPVVGSTIAVRFVGSDRERSVVCPSELKDEVVGELKQKGVLVEERKPEAFNLLYVGLAFFLVLSLLGAAYVFKARKT